MGIDPAAGVDFVAERRRDEDPRHKWSPSYENRFGPSHDTLGYCYRCGRGWLTLLSEWLADGRQGPDGGVLPGYTMEMFENSSCDGERRVRR